MGWLVAVKDEHVFLHEKPLLVPERRAVGLKEGETRVRGHPRAGRALPLDGERGAAACRLAAAREYVGHRLPGAGETFATFSRSLHERRGRLRRLSGPRREGLGLSATFSTSGAVT